MSLKSICLISTLISTNVYPIVDDKEFFPRDNKTNTDTVIIEKDGRILYEYYDRGYDKNTKHLSWSMAKTITGILVGIAIDEKYLSLSDKVSKFFPNFKGEATVKDVLQMSSGINFEEIYSGIPVSANVVRMLYLDGPKLGFDQYSLSLPLREQKPGEYYYYSSGDTNILMGILKKALSLDQYNDYPWKKIFNKLEINDAVMEQDSKGTFVGSSYMYMSPKSYLKLGRLMMNKGRYNNQQIIPSWYFELMTKVAPGVLDNSYNPNNKRAYSAQLHINKNFKGEEEFTMLPEDILMMLGHQGQIVAASPSQKLIILRLGTDKQSLDKKKFFNRVWEYTGAVIGGKYRSNNNIRHGKKGYVEVKKKSPSISLLDISFSDLLKVPKLITALAAKEICSCMFVVKRRFDQCRKDVAIKLPFSPLIQVKGSFVKAYLPFISHSKAEFRNDRLGCYLE